MIQLMAAKQRKVIDFLLETTLLITATTRAGADNHGKMLYNNSIPFSVKDG